MAYRGYFALDGVEIANSSRVSAHLATSTPVLDPWLVGVVESPVGPEDPAGSGLYFPGSLVPTGDGLYGTDGLQEGPQGLYDPATVSGPCALTQASFGLWNMPSESVEVRPGLWTLPNGAVRRSDGLYEIDSSCPTDDAFAGCGVKVVDDDSWPGLREYLDDNAYRLHTAPWFTTLVPESAEFGGVWVTDVKGLGPTPVQRSVTEMIGAGASANRHRDASRVVQFDAVLVASTNAGLEFGVQWLSCRIRDATTTPGGARLSYLSSHPGSSAAQPETLARELYGAVLTKGITVTEVAGRRDAQATMYRVQWELTITHPYAYAPRVVLPVEWDEIIIEPIEWVHAADCPDPASCDEDMDVLFSATCAPEVVDIVSSNPPSCGGCLPVCEIDRYVYRVPSREYARRCSETTVSIDVANEGSEPLTLQLYWRRCGAGELCNTNLMPLQVSGLPVSATLKLDSVSGRYTADVLGRTRRPVGIVGTPSGAPWRPVVIDRADCWELVVEADATAEFLVRLTLADREL